MWSKKPSPQAERARAALKGRDAHGSEGAWLDAVLAELRGDEPLQPDTLEALEIVLRPGGSEYVAVTRDPEAHVRFWRTLADRSPATARLRGLLADTLLIAGRTEEALPLFVETFERDPEQVTGFDGSVHDLIKQAGGGLWLRDRLALFRRTLDSCDAGHPEDQQAARDLYLELLREFAGDPDAVRQIQLIAPATLK
jgi:hypothetical protein